MVGRPTSRGCSTCRTRRIKCDLGRPTCNKCLEAGWPCPGYADRFIVDGIYRKQITSSNTKKRRNSLLLPRRDPILTLHPSDSNRLRLNFIYKLHGDALSAKLIMMPITQVLVHIPARIGSNRALDDAVACISQHPSSSAPFQRHQTTRGDALYLRALSSLRAALASPVPLPETLAAANLLQMYEQHLSPSSRRWKQHARGVVRMLQVREAQGLLEGDIELAILSAQVGNTVLASLARDEGNLFSKPVWEAAMAYSSPSPGRDNTDTFASVPAANRVSSSSEKGDDDDDDEDDDMLETFMQMVTRGRRVVDPGRFLHDVIGKCGTEKFFPSQVSKAMLRIAEGDFVHASSQLRARLERETINEGEEPNFVSYSVSSYPSDSAQYSNDGDDEAWRRIGRVSATRPTSPPRTHRLASIAATQVLLIVTTSATLRIHHEIHVDEGDTAAAAVETFKRVKIERDRVLHTVCETFRALYTQDPDLYAAVVGALRLILETLLPGLRTRPRAGGEVDVRAMLRVLDTGLADEGWG